MPFRSTLSVDGGSGDFPSSAAQGFDVAAKNAETRIAIAHTAAIRVLMKQDVAKLRADVAGGGFYNGVKLSRTWQGRVYPTGKPSAEAAGYIVNRAATIIDAFALGVTITVVNAKYLAIPEGPAKAIVRRLNQAQNRTRDAFGRFDEESGTVMRVARALGVAKLEARIDKGTGRGVLVAVGKSITRTGKMSAAKGARPDTVLFALVRAATLKQRIRGRALLAELQASAPADFDAALLARSALDGST